MAFSSISAKTKSDQVLIRIADLYGTHYDPLARAVRPRPPLPLSTVISADADADDHSSAPSPASSARDSSIPMMYSSEIPSDYVTLLPLANSELATSAVDELVPLRDFDVHIFNLPMLSSLPALLDLNIATYVSRPPDRPSGPCPCTIVRSSMNGCGRTCCTANHASQTNRFALAGDGRHCISQ
ncbi:hypothetical protein BGW80DRAFT_251583 [Lactifluus volemus]|nr:hypothetical protein BGW80DRAFT_251583 [Lactifluus volemus]